MITVRFGSKIATEVGNSHEDELPQQVEPVTFAAGPEALSRADSMVDLLNNQIGRVIGGSGSASPRFLAGEVLEQFHNYGLYTTEQYPNGMVRTVKTRISDAQYSKALGVLGSLNDNGFTPDEQNEHERLHRIDSAESIRLRQSHIQD
jgi:hypothetical protein